MSFRVVRLVQVLQLQALFFGGLVVAVKHMRAAELRLFVHPWVL